MKIIRQLKEYIKHTLDIDIITTGWNGEKDLPFFLRDSYKFLHTDILGYKYILMVDLKKVETPPSTIKKHILQLQKKWNGDVIYIRAQVTAHNRSRLIKNKTPFIIPKNQLYLPMLAIDLREHFSVKQTTVTKLSPATQLLVLYSIYKHQNLFDCNTTNTEWAQVLEYSKMTITRAFRELQNILSNTGDIETYQGKILWEHVKPYLTTPVRHRYYYDIKLPKSFKIILAGDSGLAHYTALAEPDHKTICMDIKQWREFKNRFNPIELDCPEPDTLEIEVWKYIPDKLARNGIADPLSIYLSSENNSDERITMALENILENQLW